MEGSALVRVRLRRCEFSETQAVPGPQTLRQGSDLIFALAAKEKKGEPITPPGLPLPAAEQAAFITDDCIRVEPPSATPRKLI